MDISISESKDTICSCNSCLARNYDSKSTPLFGKRVDRLYNLKVGSMVLTLCDECLDKMVELVNSR